MKDNTDYGYSTQLLLIQSIYTQLFSRTHKSTSNDKHIELISMLNGEFFSSV